MSKLSYGGEYIREVSLDYGEIDGGYLWSAQMGRACEFNIATERGTGSHRWSCSTSCSMVF